ncbi:HNH endonuclease domain-containing protein [Acinetobacter radioresistens]|uniref:HNH endonuclease domain-containing protein n=1 Tax=Acinetobacter radioresistens TaxID=40216 RepID=UPI003B2885FE
MSEFYEIEPTLENYWRSIILFGRNVASYKFAMAKSLYELKSGGNTVITLDQLAEPFSHHICEHLKLVDKQTTSASSKFLDFCRAFNANEIDQQTLIAKTVQYGFVNVIDAFHNVHGQELPKRFFIDARKTHQGIILTDEVFQLFEESGSHDLVDETEARWRLVETAWEMNLPKNLVQIHHDDQGILIAENKIRRINVTSAKSALNGYQKSRCFYCFKPITIEQLLPHSADVDHFFPHKLRECDQTKPVNGVANLVLACPECNRGVGGKFDQLPSVDLLERLYRRNEYLITSHHPLRETLINQTGFTETHRKNFLQQAYNCATQNFGMKHKWRPHIQANAIF